MDELLFNFTINSGMPWVDAIVDNAMGKTTWFTSSFPYMSVYIIINFLMFALHGYINLRSLWFLKSHGGSVYEISVGRFSMGCGALDFIYKMAFNITGVNGLIFAFAVTFTNYMEWSDYLGIIPCLMAYTMKDVCRSVLVVPFNIYETFWLNAEFNTTSKWRFAKDEFITRAMGYTLSFLLAPALIIADHYSGGAFPIMALMVVIPVLVVFILLWEFWLEGKFSKFSPLPEGALKDKIFKLANSVEFPTEKIFVKDFSARTLHNNAYMQKKLNGSFRLVLADNTITKKEGAVDFSDEQILAIVAHELGHWKCGHLKFGGGENKWWSFFKKINWELFEWQLFMLARKDIAFYNAFGFPHGMGELETIYPIFVSFSSPLKIISNLRQCARIHKHEFEADAYARQLGYGEHLATALELMNKKSKHAMEVDSFVALFTSHPSTKIRMDKLRPKIIQTIAVKKEQ